MLLQVQSLTSHFPPSALPPTTTTTAYFSKPSLSVSKPSPSSQFFTQLKLGNPCPRFPVAPPKCSVSVVSEPGSSHLELTSTDNHKPFPAEVSRTIVELASRGTLSALTQESEHGGWPLGIGVRFAVDSQGTPVLCLKFDTSVPTFLPNNGTRSSLHVQLDQCRLRTPQCTLLGNLQKVEDQMASKKLRSLWKKNFGEEVDEGLLYVVSVERILHMEDFGEDGVWVTSADYKLANPDPLRGFAEKIVDEINANNMEDVYRFCNIYADLGFQVLDAKMVWVDRLGFDMRVTSTQNDVFDFRIPFPGEVTDEKGAKSAFNCMSQLAWEVEKNFQVPEFKRVKQLKKITSRC
ncbi:glutamyl-tRNA reductase-binding protein, chloroplastic-like [Coffea arabica]|uniref:Glutamyl-tRNA reductase-binding protein, chloroplastic-like n=1 Tax=Coffea arabica TaxID=13443 RepID=A0A6P6X7D9_COFAR|nr:glutamyl-tRNA reductase-binding protein, chloroplastic-like [Coffea arabica]